MTLGVYWWEMCQSQEEDQQQIAKRKATAQVSGL